jgi:predicted NAD/FAD-binding protein
MTSHSLLKDYLAPMGGAIWSAPASEMLDLPAENIVAFCNNHWLLQYDRPVWRTVKGFSRNYVDKFTAAFRDRVRLDDRQVAHPGDRPRGSATACNLRRTSPRADDRRTIAPLSRSPLSPSRSSPLFVGRRSGFG